jgi:hypothetical protein
MSIPCHESLRYTSHPPDLSAYRERRGPFLTGDCRGDAAIRFFILPPEPDPDAFYNRVNCMASEANKFFALLAAVNLHLFDHLTVPVTGKDLTRHYPGSDQIPELLQVLCACGFVNEKDGGFVNTPQADVFLACASPYSQEEYIKKLRSKTHELWLRLPDIIETGPVFYDKKEFFLRMTLPSMAANALTGRLQQVVRTILELPGLPDTPRMLDLGGGHGIYAIALARLCPGMTCTVFDLPEVINAAKDSVAQYGLGDRVTTLAGDFFRDSFGSGYDIILSSSTPCGKRTEMIPRITDALNFGGYFVNVQGGDAERERDCIQELEGRMWRFSDEPEWRTRGGKPRPFLSDHYLESLQKSGMELVSIDRVPDPFRQDDAVTMLVSRKPYCPADRHRYALERDACGLVRAPWERPSSSVGGPSRRGGGITERTGD